MACKQLEIKDNTDTDTDTDSDDSDGIPIIAGNTTKVTVDMRDPHTNNVFMFYADSNVYVFTPYWLTGEHNQIEFLIKHKDQTSQNVTSSENICLVKCSSKDICIYYIPKLFTRSIQLGPTIVDIKSGNITHGKSGILFDENTILTAIDVSDWSSCRMISTDGSAMRYRNIRPCGESCRHISLDTRCSDYTLIQWWQGNENITNKKADKKLKIEDNTATVTDTDSKCSAEKQSAKRCMDMIKGVGQEIIFNHSKFDCLALLEEIIIQRESILLNIEQKHEELKLRAAKSFGAQCLGVGIIVFSVAVAAVTGGASLILSPVGTAILAGPQLINYVFSKEYKAEIARLIKEDETRIERLHDLLEEQRNALTYVPENIKKFIIDYWEISGLLEAGNIQFFMAFVRIDVFIVAFFTMVFTGGLGELISTLKKITEKLKTHLPELQKIQRLFKNSPRLSYYRI